MGKIRDIDAECKFSQALTVTVFERALPQHAIATVLDHHTIAAARECKQTLVLMSG